MPLQIVPFRDEHLDSAAALRAARHRVDRGRFPELPQSFERVDITAPTLATALHGESAFGVVALRQGRMAGYLLGTTVMPAPMTVGAGFIAARSLAIGPTGYAAEPDDAYELYRMLYAALAPHWVERGCFDHYITVVEGDGAALAAWFSLGFGRNLVFGLRDTAPIAAPELPGVEIHRAGPEDIEVVFALAERLSHYHAEAPIYLPRLPENEPAARTQALEALAAPADHATFVAYRDGAPLALIELTPPFAAQMSTPEHSTYLLHGYTRPDARGGGIGSALLARALEWVRETGYTSVTINWFAANVAGARFWRRSGFRPLTCRLHRRIDERVAWGR